MASAVALIWVGVACSNSYTSNGNVDDTKEGGIVTPTSADSGPSPERVCGAGKKLCSGECVAFDDPRYGCAAESCEPCALTNTKAHSCNAEGKCAVEQCAPGWDYCHLDQGCTVDPLSPETCGGCAVRGGKNCALQEVCSEGSCKNQCDPVPEKTITNCGRSCVDLSTHPRHCGACKTECMPTPGGSAACATGKCVVDCDENHGHCKGDVSTCESLLPVYKDNDGDTWGSTPVLVPNGILQKFACAPGAGEAIRGGDCLDDAAVAASRDVFPGQTRFFTKSFPLAGQDSFDYNCNGKTDLNQPSGGSCSPCVRGFIGKVTCGVASSYASCGLVPIEEEPALEALEIARVPVGGSSGIPACPTTAIPSCR